MSRYETLGETIKKVRFEAGQSANPGHGGHDREKIVHLINRVQHQLALGNDWPRREETAVIETVAGCYTYTLPEPLFFESIRRITRQGEAGSAVELAFGIGPEHRAHSDPDDPARYSSKPRAWDYAATNENNIDCINIWPTPEAGVRLFLEGTGWLRRVETEEGRLAFPGDIIALYVASELLAEQGDELAQSKRAMADNMTRKMLGRQQGKGQGWSLGRAYNRTRRLRYGRDYAG